MTRAALAAFMLAAAGVQAQPNQAAPTIEVWPVRDNVFMLVGAGGNTTVQVGSDGVLVVDTKLEIGGEAC